MKIVLFTNFNLIGLDLLKNLAHNNIVPFAIFVEAPRSKAKYLTFSKSDGFFKAAGIFRSALKVWMLRNLPTWFIVNLYKQYSDKIFIVDNFSGKQCEQLLTEIKPDIVILGGCFSIIKKNILEIAQKYVFNIHPALLPKYRGVSVVQWSIYKGDPVGVTVHAVDEGVDTGGIVAQKKVEIDKKDTIESLRRRIYWIGGELLSQIIIKMNNSENIEIIPQSQMKETGELFRQMSDTMQRETQKRLRVIQEKMK